MEVSSIPSDSEEQQVRERQREEERRDVQYPMSMEDGLHYSLEDGGWGCWKETYNTSQNIRLVRGPEVSSMPSDPDEWERRKKLRDEAMMERRVMRQNLQEKFKYKEELERYGKNYQRIFKKKGYPGLEDKFKTTQIGKNRPKDDLLGVNSHEQNNENINIEYMNISSIPPIRLVDEQLTKEKDDDQTLTGPVDEQVIEPDLWFNHVRDEVNNPNNEDPAVFNNTISICDDEEEQDEDADNPSENNQECESTSRGFDDNILSQPSGRCSSLSKSTATSTTASIVRSTRKRKVPIEKKQEQFLDLAASVLGNQKKFKAFGNNVAFQLDDMDRVQQIIAEKLISDVLFHGKLGTLKTSSAVVTDQLTQPNVYSSVEHSNTHYSGNKQNQPQNLYQNHYQQPYNFEQYNYQNPF